MRGGVGAVGAVGGSSGCDSAEGGAVRRPAIGVCTPARGGRREDRRWKEDMRSMSG